MEAKEKEIRLGTLKKQFSIAQVNLQKYQQAVMQEQANIIALTALIREYETKAWEVKNEPQKDKNIDGTNK